jgi:hypothetical protein
LICSCKGDFPKRDKAVTSSGNIADTAENIYFIKDGSIYIINKNNLSISDSGLKGDSIYTFRENLYYIARKDLKHFIYNETDELLSTDQPADGFIVTGDFIYIDGTYATGMIYNYDRKNGILSETTEKTNGFPIISEDESAVYMMRTSEGRKDESGHVPVNHILSLNGSDLGSFAVYDCRIAFNSRLYVYKDNLYYAESGNIVEVNLVSGEKNVILTAGDEMIAAAHGRLYYRSGTDLHSLNLSGGQIQKYPCLFNEDSIIYVDSYEDAVYEIDLMAVTVNKLTVADENGISIKQEAGD